MTFPVYFHLLGLRLHPHPAMEILAYTGGFQLYRRLRKRFPRAATPFEQSLWIFVGAVFGALLYTGVGRVEVRSLPGATVPLKK